MPVHDWTRVPAGIFHHFHHDWITEISRALNSGILPDNYYAMAAQQAAGSGPDILTLQALEPGLNSPAVGGDGSSETVTLIRPQARFTSQSDVEFYRRKKSSIAIRHVSDDRLVAVVEIVSPGNKAARNAFRAFLDKVCELLENKIHLLIIDLFPPTRRDPQGIHAAIWQEVVDEAVFTPPPDKPLTLVAYESDLVVKAFVEPVAVGDCLPPMPLILEPDAAVKVPVEETYQLAYTAVPRRWRQVLEPSDGSRH
jgi:hypothetical protein